MEAAPMDSGRIRRTARRGIAVATLGWLLAVAGSVLAAPAAEAAPTATVAIRDLTPPLVSVDAGGSVTFVNQIADKPVTVQLPLLGGIAATAHTDVSLAFGGGAQPLAPGASMTKTFPGTTAGVITYTYRIDVQSGLASNLVDQVVNGATALLPALPAPTPFVVNTLVPLPNLPSVNLPSLPPVAVPTAVPTTPNTPTAQPSGTTSPTAPVAETPAAAPATQAPVDGTAYSYGTVSSAGQMAPLDTSAAAAFDPSRFATGDAASTAGGGGNAGTYDGASVPVFGDLAGLGGGALGSGAGDDVETVADSAAGTPDPALSIPALAAVVALAGVTAALVRTHRAQRTAG
ncbi:hypothetical protein [Geodermatophilus sp. Leaf369]|uniref:hypothetical protein n=1 Tax=Geodermatophilus sp. Leaf369 TaxID=1736354 RepID=UPI00138F77C4|nr:hypothetical protein [Geodermatophilus sp. Leaf369]